jgi:hypothetical protein
MNSQQRTDITAPASGLFVYDTDTKSFWFYNGTVWTNLSLSATPGWLLTGNAGSNAGTDFVGTSDNQPLRFRVNNAWAGEINAISKNVFFGPETGKSVTTGVLNTAIGAAALANNLVSSNNVAVGDSSLYSHNGATGGGNTAVGTHSLFSSTNSNGNTALGYYSLWRNIGGDFNTALGLNSLSNNINGFSNTAVGSRSLQFNISGSNTAVGANALRFNSTGGSNTATGTNALYSNGTGYANTAMGSGALEFNTIGTANSALGTYALENGSTADENTAVGAYALTNQSFDNGGVSWTSGNVAIGYAALFSNNPQRAQEGIENTAVGHKAMYSNLSGLKNSALGSSALYNNSTGSDNTASGSDALFLNSKGNLNTATGAASLYQNTTGSANVATGNGAMFSNSTGGRNVAIGVSALQTNISGDNNTILGAFANNDGADLNDNTIVGSDAHSSASNTVVIGAGAFTNTPNLALLGNPFTKFTGGYTNWSNFSDGRFKKDMDENVRGLDFILRLRPVTYHMDVRGLYKLWGISPYPKRDSVNEKHSHSLIDEAIKEKEAVRMTGFVAQEVEKAARETNFDFDGIMKPAHDKDHYRLAYGEFVVPLVKAVQEQQKIIEKQNNLISQLSDRIAALEKKL